MSAKQLHILLSQADADRLGFEHAGHSTLALENAADTFARLQAAGFVGFEVPAATRGEEAELDLGRRLDRFDPEAESVFMFRQFVGG